MITRNYAVILIAQMSHQSAWNVWGEVAARDKTNVKKVKANTREVKSHDSEALSPLQHKTLQRTRRVKICTDNAIACVHFPTWEARCESTSALGAQTLIPYLLHSGWADKCARWRKFIRNRELRSMHQLAQFWVSCTKLQVRFGNCI